MSIITDRYGKRAPENAERQSPEPLSFYGSPVPETGSSGTAPDNGIPVEKHPWQPFIPDGAKVLMLGSFPPKKERWSMDFFYPNFNNDMWRIIGIVFFGDKDRFIAKCGIPGSGGVAQPVKRFDKDGIIRFCSERGLALYDTAYEVRRLKDNASDRFLEIVAPVDIRKLLHVMPECRAVVTTGEKAGEAVAVQLGCRIPKPGCHTDVVLPSDGQRACPPDEGRMIRFFRLPSSSRAYPLSLERKAEAYSVLKTLLDTGYAEHSEKK